MKKTKKTSPDKLKSSDEPKKIKGLGLFDHIKQVRHGKNPDYYNNLTKEEKKGFSNFAVLKGLSMNPHLLGDVSFIFRYFDKIPPPQFYQLLISLIPSGPEREYYPWVKAKSDQYSPRLIQFIANKFEISTTEAKSYAEILYATEEGKSELFDICKGNGLEVKEVEKILANKDDN